MTKQMSKFLLTLCLATTASLTGCEKETPDDKPKAAADGGKKASAVKADGGEAPAGEAPAAEAKADGGEAPAGEVKADGGEAPADDKEKKEG